MRIGVSRDTHSDRCVRDRGRERFRVAFSPRGHETDALLARERPYLYNDGGHDKSARAFKGEHALSRIRRPRTRESARQVFFRNSGHLLPLRAFPFSPRSREPLRAARDGNPFKGHIRNIEDTLLTHKVLRHWTAVAVALLLIYISNCLLLASTHESYVCVCALLFRLQQHRCLFFVFASSRRR